MRHPRVELVRADEPVPVDTEELPNDDAARPRVGDWYWVHEAKAKDPGVTIDEADDEDEEGERVDSKGPWFGCVVYVGSNYAKLRSPGRTSFFQERVHFDSFDLLKREHVPQTVIDSQVERCRGRVVALLAEVKDATARLAITTGPMLAQQGQSRALALVGQGRDMGEYKKALVKAKEKELPELFKQIEKANEEMAVWMSAPVLPLEAHSRGLKDLISAIDDRVFSVELYAGLVEKVTRVRKGKPAELGESIHLYQRRAYMDEECLAAYETGGMRFDSIGAFDKWIAKSENMNRLLPFQRTVLAMRVRRKRYNHGVVAASFSEWIRIMEEAKMDEMTFLYLRNGEQLYRLSTGIDFGGHLFPDMDEDTSGAHYVNVYWGRVEDEKILTEAQYRGRMEEMRKEEAEEKAARAKWDKMTPAEREVEGHFYFHRRFLHGEKWEKADPSSVYFDDVRKIIEGRMRDHNRIALVLQGLLDRSPVFKPHPPWQLATEEGFRQAIVLRYDDSRALVSGPRPDFEAYRRRLATTIGKGSITIGQHDLWLRKELKKENDRRAGSWRHRGDRHVSLRWWSGPDGNPGPGRLAQVVRFSKSSRRCVYEWERERMRHKRDWAGRHIIDDSSIQSRFDCDADLLFHATAYTPGDFHQFFDDPRTRADYLQWAPILLLAEEFKAGNEGLGGRGKVTCMEDDDE